MDKQLSVAAPKKEQKCERAGRPPPKKAPAGGRCAFGRCPAAAASVPNPARVRSVAAVADFVVLAIVVVVAVVVVVVVVVIGGGGSVPRMFGSGGRLKVDAPFCGARCAGERAAASLRPLAVSTRRVVNERRWRRRRQRPPSQQQQQLLYAFLLLATFFAGIRASKPSAQRAEKFFMRASKHFLSRLVRVVGFLSLHERHRAKNRAARDSANICASFDSRARVLLHSSIGRVGAAISPMRHYF